MSEFLESHEDKILRSILDEGLEIILEGGFITVGDCILLERTYPSNYNKTVLEKEDIEDPFVDFSGYEYSINKFHIEDFTDKEPFIQAVLFARAFKERWLNAFSEFSCTMVVGFQDDEIGRFATFTFHKNRMDEIVFKNDHLEKITQPIYIDTGIASE